VRRLQERRPVAALSDADEAAAPPETGRAGGRRRVLFTLLTAAAVVAADQVTKSLALGHLRGPVHVGGPFGLRLAFNSGAAFSLFTGATGVMVVIALVEIAVLAYVAWRSHSAWLSASLGLVLGGALGNLSDRLFRSHHGDVVDFITLTHWPTFNVADAAITIGAVVVVSLSLLRPARARR
jgi:signal peptidase II